MTRPDPPPGRAGSPPSWLAVIDMQRVFGDPGSDWFAPRFAEIVGPVRRLADAFRPRVTFTRFIAPEVPQGAWRQYYQQWPFALQPPGARIYELVDELAAGAGPGGWPSSTCSGSSARPAARGWRRASTR